MLFREETGFFVGVISNAREFNSEQIPNFRRTISDRSYSCRKSPCVALEVFNENQSSNIGSNALARALCKVAAADDSRTRVGRSRPWGIVDQDPGCRFVSLRSIGNRRRSTEAYCTGWRGICARNGELDQSA